METFDIRQYGDPVLRKAAEPTATFEGDLNQLAEKMLATMYKANGIGLAAQQVGLTLPLCVLDVPEAGDLDETGEPNNPGVEMPLVLVEPVVEPLDEDLEVEIGEEGCLSFPDIHLPVPRSPRIRVAYKNLAGEAKSLSVQGLLARAIQHEVDHLNGVLFIDHVPPVRKIAVAGRIKRLRRETERALGRG